MQSSESLGVLTLIFPSAPVVQGWTTACDWLEAPLLGHSPCHRFIESCPQGVLRTIRVVIQPESSGWGIPNGSSSVHAKLLKSVYITCHYVTPTFNAVGGCDNSFVLCAAKKLVMVFTVLRNKCAINQMKCRCSFHFCAHPGNPYFIFVSWHPYDHNGTTATISVCKSV